MPRHGYTIKPCHGCGSTDEHKQGELCDECKSRMFQGEQALEIQKKLTVNKNFIAVLVPENMNSPALFPGHTELFHKCEYDRLGKIFSQLIRAISFDAVNRLSFYYDSGPYECSTVEARRTLFNIDLSNFERKKVILIGSKTADCLEILFEEIKKELSLREDAAFKYGKSLLVQLNNGNITLNEFDEKKDED